MIILIRRLIALWLPCRGNDNEASLKPQLINRRHVMSAVIENNGQVNLSQHLPTCEKIEMLNYHSVKRRVLYWKAVSRQRKQLAKLDDHLLADIGLSREQVQVEVSKPFWR